ncbi:MAG: Do family serine endopeptidase [Silvanigrellales bacterium]|nr:Do family serine endopeptidase [Silvanigrellales bacterium]
MVIKNRMKVLGFAMLVVAALVGVGGVGVLFFAPERVDDIQRSVTAMGSEYTLPKTPSLVDHGPEETRVLTTFSKVFVNIAKQTRPALVYIRTRRTVAASRQRLPFPEDFFFPFQQPGSGRERDVQEGAGSGFLVDLDKGYVITNNHVVDSSEDIRVKTFDDREFKARLVGREASVDVAVLQLTDFNGRGLAQVGFGDSNNVEVGDWVVALGAPFSLPQTLTMGVISAVGRGNVVGNGALEDFIQTDAAINPGNSGGPLLNLEGQVVGVNTAIASNTGSSAGIGFAVPSNMVRLAAEMLINEGRVTRGFLGVEGRDFKELPDEVLANLKVDTTNSGTLIINIVKESPAEKAGLRTYDVIATLGGVPVTSFAQLRAKLAFTKPGTAIELGIVREGKPLTVTVTIGAFDDGRLRAGREGNDSENESDGNGVLEAFGILAAPLNPALREELGVRATKGAILTDVDEESEAALAGLRRGDVIVEINRAAVTGPSDVKNALEKAQQAGRDVLFLVERGGRDQLILYRQR